LIGGSIFKAQHTTPTGNKDTTGHQTCPIGQLISNTEYRKNNVTKITYLLGFLLMTAMESSIDTIRQGGKSNELVVFTE